MKIITFYSDSHYEMYNDYFLSSYNKHLSEHKLIAKKIEHIMICLFLLKNPTANL